MSDTVSMEIFAVMDANCAQLDLKAECLLVTEKFFKRRMSFKNIPDF